MIALNEDVIAAVRAAGETAYPEECCGFLLGRLDARGRTAETALPAENAWDEGDMRRRFKIDPDDYLRAERAAAAQGLDVTGFYHSHPDHPARPSDFDLAQALPCYSYVIVAVEDGRATDLTSWELAADRSDFIPESIL
ncbi:MAG: M67 family metallopeptidase [Desulfovibrio sp.]|jgi:proteasome lid subunit RPN8/RPN11|nr:M67 family metallopeptidase [Desulfovibrio sp.]